ncbi:tyrosine-protein phosphatase [Haliea sp. E17]|uniref:tyrosine-protein phosphatase n=1 Tax=Haliea sp. E17 TaxID=3401576 RepID=UPI003AAC6C0B
MLNKEAVLIWREASGDYHVQWEQSSPDTQVQIEPLADVQSVQERDEAGLRARFSGLPAGNRHFFRLSDQHGNELLAAERRLGMHGTPNFRDYGGYTGADGRRVKWGYLFRSGQLAHLSDADLELLASLDLELVCDFRQTMEQVTHPSRLPEAGQPRVLNVPVIPGNSSSFFAQAEEHRAALDNYTRQDMFDFMCGINRDFAEGQRDTFARVFREILELEAGRFLVHCSAGKDRTGFAAALMLLALGVPREVVMQDYLLTGNYFDPELELQRVRKKYDLHHLNSDVVLPILEVHEDYLAAALASIDSNFGSVERYLEEGLGLGPEGLAELRRRYLEP